VGPVGIIEESRESYYETLHASSQGWHEGRHDCHPWLSYFWGVMQRASDEFEQRVGSIADGKTSKSDLVRQAILRHVGRFTSTDIERQCPGVSAELIRVVIRQLRDDGTITLHGRGRGEYWLRS